MYFGRTDCSLPMIWATEKNIPVDTFIIWTDNETWAGNIHPSIALKKYRQKTGIDSKLIVCATEASKFTIADPKDRGMLDIAGFDSAVPQIIRSFSLGEF
jgi:60 kDa SS-A/Ro ribonucleoprotein